MVGEGYLVGAGGVTNAALPTLRERREGGATTATTDCLDLSFYTLVPQEQRYFFVPCTKVTHFPVGFLGEFGITTTNLGFHTKKPKSL